MEKKLFNFIESSPTAFHAVENACNMLREVGYTELFESNKWSLTDGGKYFVRRGGSSLIAFRYREGAKSLTIAASHSDFPALKIKATPETSDSYNRLEVEKYGGPIHYSWLDRPLGVAGRVTVAVPCGVENRLVKLDTLVTIPSLAIHLNRSVNESCSLNPAVDLLPLYSTGREVGSFFEKVAQAAGVTADELLGADLFLYNAEGAYRIGADGELFIAPRIDNLASVFASTVALCEAKESDSIPVLAVFDNEEVGSSTKQGAASSFLPDTLKRILGESLNTALASSLMLSVDGAHAKHPNHPELSDRSNAPLLCGGVALKFNAQQRYTTDGESAALVALLAARAGVKLQRYHNRADLPGGSTLGAIASLGVSVPTADLGIPMLAMHSSVECASAQDFKMLTALITELFSSSPQSNENGYSI